MKDRASIRMSLGNLTQDQIAHTLTISRSQWAMFETGRRSLTTRALILLGKLTQHVESPDLSKENETANRILQAERNQLNELMIRNELRLTRMAARVAKLEEKLESNIRFVKTKAFMKDYEATNDSGIPSFFYSRHLPEDWLEKTAAKLLKCRVRLATLESERKFLQQTVKEKRF